MPGMNGASGITKIATRYFFHDFSYTSVPDMSIADALWAPAAPFLLLFLEVRVSALQECRTLQSTFSKTLIF